MKTPDEIKKGLEGCKDKSNCEWCNLIDQCKRNADVLAYINQLEETIARQKERYRSLLETASILSDAVDELERCATDGNN